MHTGGRCVGEHETLTTAAQHMRELGVGALPICGDGKRPARSTEFRFRRAQ